MCTERCKQLAARTAKKMYIHSAQRQALEAYANDVLWSVWYKAFHGDVRDSFNVVVLVRDSVVQSPK
jgi:hypothetical protein